MNMPTVKSIRQKKHAENEPKLFQWWQPRVSRLKSLARRLKLSELAADSTFRAVKISIIIPAFNEERLLGASLKANQGGSGRVHDARLGG